MTELLNRPELALASALAVALLWLGLAFWIRLRPVGDDLGERLDALAGAALRDTPAVDRYARFEHRDYSGDRGPCPQAQPRYATIYDELCARLGFRP